MKYMYDVAVAGAGAFGSWIALELARRGKRVLLTDPYGAGNSRSSSGGETRIIRMSYGPDPLYTSMSLRSLPRWRALGDSIFRPRGALFTARPGDEYFEGSARVLSNLGVRAERLNNFALKRRFPHIRFLPDSIGLFEPESGILMARQAVARVCEAAVGAGVAREQWALHPTGYHRQFPAEQFVFACGPWLPKLFPKVIGDRIQPTRQEVFYFGTPSGPARFRYKSMPPWVDFDSSLYALPDIDGRGVKVALHRNGPPFDPENADRLVTASAVSKMRALVTRFLPALADSPLVESQVCQYENTCNGDFLIDEIRPGIWIAGGGSGHGFKHGPAVGEYVADLMERKRKPEPRFTLATKTTRLKRVVH